MNGAANDDINAVSPVHGPLRLAYRSDSKKTRFRHVWQRNEDDWGKEKRALDRPDTIW